MRDSSHCFSPSGERRGFLGSIFNKFPAKLCAKSALLIGCVAACAAVFGADPEPVRRYLEAEQQARFESLMEQFGQNKELPPSYELQTLLALSHYPELADVRIRFIVDDVDIPLSSRPWWASMLNNARNRTYLVVIDSEREGAEENGRAALLLKNQPFNAQVGIIGHELAHTVYYLDRSFFGILGDALCQLSRCRINFERETDRRLVSYGLGWQRYDHALYVRTQMLGSEEAALAAEGGGGAYMSPSELLREMREFESYAD